MMKRLGIAFMLVTIALQGFSKRIDIEEAKLVSEMYLKSESKTALTVDEAVVFQGNETPLTYVINFIPEGWAIVSADDRARAILGYSTKGHFDTKEVKSLPFYFWFQGYADQISNMISSKAPEVVDPSWSKIKTSKNTRKVSAIEPLIPVLWNQGAGWNKYCPVDAEGPGGHVYAGCVAVAMAQCMSVFEYPTQGYGSHSYTADTYGTQSVNFGTTTYDWANMTATGSSDAVALLLYHLGVSVNMDYSVDGSGALSGIVPSAIKNYFGYSSSADYISKDDYADADWESTLIDQLKMGNPIYYSGDAGDGEAGHAFNIDGLSSSGLFHFNFGWSGSNNGYFALTSITPGGSNFSSDQGAVINFMPRDNAPQDISFSANIVEEGMPVGTIVGRIIVTDETPDDTFTYEVSGPNSDGGAVTTVPFAEQDGNLVTTEILDYSYKKRYEVVVIVTDKTDLSFEKNLFVNVDSNSAPTNITINRTVFPDTTAIGLYIGKLATVDADKGDTFTYSFEDNTSPGIGKDNGKFTISNDTLFLNYDFTTFEGTQCSIYIKSTDKKDQTVSKELLLTVNKTTGVSIYTNNIEKSIKLYPNPTSDYITISGTEAYNDIETIYIYNTVGNLCKVVDVNRKDINVDISDYQSGIYFVKIKMMSGVSETLKVIKRD